MGHCNLRWRSTGHATIQACTIQIFRDESSVQDIAGGYQSVHKEADSVVADATVTGENGAAFAFEDVWRINGASLLL